MSDSQKTTSARLCDSGSLAERTTCLMAASDQIGRDVAKVLDDVDNALAKKSHVLTSQNTLIEQYKTLISPESIKRADELIRKAPLEPGRGRIISYYIVAPGSRLPDEVSTFLRDEIKISTKPDVKEPLFNATSNALPVSSRMEMAIALVVSDTNEKMMGTLQLVPTSSQSKAHILIAGARNTNFSGLASGSRRVLLLNEKDFMGENPQVEINTVSHELGHAFGLEHPHAFAKSPSAPSSDMIGCGRTVMAYYKQCLGNGGMPAALWQDVDLRALQELYAQKTVKTR